MPSAPVRGCQGDHACLPSPWLLRLWRGLGRARPSAEGEVALQGPLAFSHRGAMASNCWPSEVLMGGEGCALGDARG